MCSVHISYLYHFAISVSEETVFWCNIIYPWMEVVLIRRIYGLLVRIRESLGPFFSSSSNPRQCISYSPQSGMSRTLWTHACHIPTCCQVRETSTEPSALLTRPLRLFHISRSTHVLSHLTTALWKARILILGPEVWWWWLILLEQL
jgi:hypothetical protein